MVSNIPDAFPRPGYDLALAIADFEAEGGPVRISMEAQTRSHTPEQELGQKAIGLVEPSVYERWADDGGPEGRIVLH